MENHMIIRHLTLVLLSISTLGATALHAETATYEIDPDHLSIAFFVEHIGYQDQMGQFLDAEGRFEYDEQADALHSGEVTIEADSVFTNHDRRDRHLKGDDFLSADRFGTIRFEADEWQPAERGNGTLTGQLTLIGETRPVSLDVSINKSGPYPFGHEKPTLGISATTTIRRSEWGMTYGVENDLVGDEVELRFEFEAIRQ